jgi:hypothetical protein
LIAAPFRNIFCFFIALLALAIKPASAAASKDLLFDISVLDKVTTIVVGSTTAPEHTLLPKLPGPLGPGDHSNDIFVVAVKQVFASNPSISVKSSYDVPYEELKHPSVLVLEFVVSAQQETADGKNLKVGSLALQILPYNEQGLQPPIRIVPASYPFLIPDTQQEYAKKITDGVRYLIGYLPSYVSCAQVPRGYPSAECPKCQPDPCHIDEPFGEDQNPRCSVPLSPKAGAVLPTRVICGEKE